MPTEFENLDEDVESKELTEYYKWIEKANDVEQRYYKKFHNF
jgi:hypothetical protein